MLATSRIELTFVCGRRSDELLASARRARGQRLVHGAKTVLSEQAMGPVAVGRVRRVPLKIRAADLGCALEPHLAHPLNFYFLHLLK